MAALLNNYCHNTLAEAASYAYSNALSDTDPTKWATSYTFDDLAGSITVTRSVSPTYVETIFPDTCSPIGYRPWIPADFSDIAALWGAAALVIFAAWGFKMAKLALKG